MWQPWRHCGGGIVVATASGRPERGNSRGLTPRRRAIPRQEVSYLCTAPVLAAFSTQFTALARPAVEVRTAGLGCAGTQQ